MHKAATISDCGAYRYRLSRTWAVQHATMAFVMLNPSTADADVDDPTIRKCIGFATRSGYGGIEVVNLYAYRATDPKNLRAAGYPVGPDNDEHTEAVCRQATTVVCAWGVNAEGLSRPAEVLRMLKGWGIKPRALRINQRGTPLHPLMLPYSCQLVELGGGNG